MVCTVGESCWPQRLALDAGRQLADKQEVVGRIVFLARQTCKTPTRTRITTASNSQGSSTL